MNLQAAFVTHIKKENLFTQEDILLVAVSGGIDSVALCELCHRAGYHFIIAHCNFHLRGAESDRDESFVRSLGEKYNVPVLVKDIDTEAYATTNKVSIQVAARETRYAWFYSLLEDKSSEAPTLLLTAHHSDDNIETVMMNFCKGTGILGLKGMLPKQGKLIRPLLFASREALETFVADEKLSWVEDSSNLSDKYTRNFFRHRVIPLISETILGAADNIAANILRFQETAQIYEASINQYKQKLLEPKGNNIEIPVLKLLQQKPLHSIVYEIIKDFGFTAAQTPEIIALLQSDTGRFVKSTTHRILKNRGRLIISPLTASENNTILIDADTAHIAYEGGQLHISFASAQALTDDSNIALLDAKQIRFPILLRKWKTGDYFYPLGMAKKKKLARFFIDRKLSLADKEKMWVLESDKRILWVVGLRIDDRFKVNDKTSNVLKIQLR